MPDVTTPASLASGPDETEKRVMKIERDVRWLTPAWQAEVRWLIASLRAALSENERLTTALREIARCEGAFSVDPLTHASNTIDNLTRIAREALSASSGERAKGSEA